MRLIISITLVIYSVENLTFGVKVASVKKTENPLGLKLKVKQKKKRKAPKPSPINLLSYGEEEDLFVCLNKADSFLNAISTLTSHIDLNY